MSKRRRKRGRRQGPAVIMEGQRPIYGSNGMGYRSTSIASDEGRVPIPGSGDFQNRRDREKLQTESRWHYRNNPIYSGMINRAASYIAGHGFGLRALSKNRGVVRKLERLWRGYMKRPEIRQTLSGSQVIKLGTRELLKVGEFGNVLGDQGFFQMIEAEQLKGPTDGRKRARNGIRVNRLQQPTAYFVAPYGSNGQVNGDKAIPYKPEDFLFVTDPDRISSQRAMPPCQSVFPNLYRINDVCDANAIAWQILSHIAVSINRTAGPEMGYEESEEDTRRSGDDFDDDLDKRITELGMALIFHGEHGDEVKGVDRNIPGQNFTESIVMFMRLLGLPLGLPIELILLDWTKANYSQSRAVLGQAYQNFLCWQMLLEDMFYTPMLEWKIREWIAAGLLPDREDIFAHDWVKPTFPWIDEIKEAKAWGMKIDRGLGTYSGALKSQNMDPEATKDVIELEIYDAIKRVEKLEKKLGDRWKDQIPWQMFAGRNPRGTEDPDPTDRPDPQGKLNEGDEG